MHIWDLKLVRFNLSSLIYKEFINLIFLSIGVLPGAFLRWQLDNYFLVNCIGCFVLGIVSGSQIKKKYKYIIGFGFCGSLTTYSGWIIDCFSYLKNGNFLEGIALLFSSIMFGLFFAFLGFFIGQRV